MAFWKPQRCKQERRKQAAGRVVRATLVWPDQALRSLPASESLGPPDGLLFYALLRCPIGRGHFSWPSASRPPVGVSSARVSPVSTSPLRFPGHSHTTCGYRGARIWPWDDCTHFGGEVHEMGFVLMFLQPAFTAMSATLGLFRDEIKTSLGRFRRPDFELFLWVCSVHWRATEAGHWVNSFL